jgi:hypothetical protein
MPMTRDEGHLESGTERSEETMMIPHPKTMQMVTDQRWDELQVKTHRERQGMTTHGQQPGAASRATLRLPVVNAVRMLRPNFCRHLQIRVPRGAQRSLIS